LAEFPRRATGVTTAAASLRSIFKLAQPIVYPVCW